MRVGGTEPTGSSPTRESFSNFIRQITLMRTWFILKYCSSWQSNELIPHGDVGDVHEESQDERISKVLWLLNLNEAACSYIVHLELPSSF